MFLCLLLQIPLGLRQFAVIALKNGHIEIDHALNTFIVEGVSQLLTGADVLQIDLVRWQVVLTGGIGDMRLQVCAMADQVGAAAQQVTCRTHLAWIGIGQGKITAAHELGDLERIDAIILGLAAVNGAHVEGVPQDEGDAMSLAEIGHPVPAVHALDPDDQVIEKGGDKLEQ